MLRAIKRMGYNMAGSVEGGRKAAATNMERYGKDFYHKLGARGAKARKKPGGFATNREFASEMGKLGGKAPRKPKVYNAA